MLFIFIFTIGVGHSANVDIEKLPDAVPRGNFKAVTVENGQPTIITIDLETTDLSKKTFEVLLLYLVFSVFSLYEGFECESLYSHSL